MPATTNIDKLRAEATEARDIANAKGAALREAEEKDQLAADAKRAAEEQAALDKQQKEITERREKKLAELAARATKIHDGLAAIWPEIEAMHKERKVPWKYYQETRDAYKALARHFKGKV